MASWTGLRAVFQTPGASHRGKQTMRSALIHVSRPELIVELVDHLRLGGLRAVLVGSESCRVFDLAAPEAQHAGIELGFFLRAWQATHPGLDVSLVLEPHPAP